MASELPLLSVSDFLALINQTLEYAYPSIEIEGEVSGFKVNQNKFVFFDLKDSGGSVGCFMTVWQLRTPIEDGMRVIVRATPKVTQWGKFSLTVASVRPSGEGSLKKSFDLLVAKLDREGLFSPERKRLLPRVPRTIGVISSVQAAGYADFIKILNERWGGVTVEVAHVQVQGEVAPDQIIRAVQYFNARQTPPEVLVIVRGGGSADDLSAFNDEQLARVIAASRVPTLVGVGHEVDTTLADMVADVRAATPSNAAQIVVPDKREIERQVDGQVRGVLRRMDGVLDETTRRVDDMLEWMLAHMTDELDTREQHVAQAMRMLAAYNPRAVLERGYAIVRGVVKIGNIITVEDRQAIITAEVKNVRRK